MLRRGIIGAISKAAYNLLVKHIDLVSFRFLVVTVCAAEEDKSLGNMPINGPQCQQGGVKRSGGILTLDNGWRYCSLSKGSKLGGLGAFDSC